MQVQDEPQRYNDAPRVYVPGTPMLSVTLLKATSGYIRSLHDIIVFLEKTRMQNKDTAYPVIMGKVPKDMGFVKSCGADMLVLRFSDIFDMFNLNPLHHSFVRLFALKMAVQIIQDNTLDIAIVDRFYMCHDILCCDEDRLVAEDYLQNFMLANESKANILMPYFTG